MMTPSMVFIFLFVCYVSGIIQLLLLYCSLRYFWLVQVKITAKDLSSLEKTKAIISNLTMVPSVGDVYRYSFS